MIVGAGVVGLACAYALALRGHRIVILDAAQPGSGASWGNAGLIAIAPSVVAPVPGPGVVATSLRWLLQRHSPLRLVPRLELDYVRWLALFVRSCSRRAAEAGLRATLALNAETTQLFSALEPDGLKFEMHHRGLLIVYRKHDDWQNACERLVDSDGGRPLTSEEALLEEPLLRRESCAGAIRYPADRNVRPDQLVAALVRRIEELGVEIRSGCPCTAIVRERGRVAAVRTRTGFVPGRAFVLAAGEGIRALARQAGMSVPVYGGRGYSFDVPREELTIRAPLYLHDGRIAITPFDDFTRVVGHMELGARTSTVRRGAIETMNRACDAALDGWRRVRPTEAWAGLRPMTPDGLPVIGRAPRLDNLFLAGGHGMLGITLSLRTGQAIAECMDNGTDPDPVLAPFTPARFA